eukprot:1145017-Pelagomonas_calceolata.AAC.2
MTDCIGRNNISQDAKSSAKRRLRTDDRTEYTGKKAFKQDARGSAKRQRRTMQVPENIGTKAFSYDARGRAIGQLLQNLLARRPSVRTSEVLPKCSFICLTK